MMKKFKIGIRFQPIGENTTCEDNIMKCHWALVVVPIGTPEWSLRVELVTANDVLYFPATFSEKVLDAHRLGIWTGYLDDILKLMEIHPMRGTSYSVAHNNCQHWAATLLVLLEAFARYTVGRRFDIEYLARYNSVMEVLTVHGTSLYHTPNSKLANVHLATFGSGAAAVGAAAIAAEATVLVPASGIMGWLGATVAVPTAGAVLATTALPFTVGAAAIAGGTYMYKNHSWKSATKFNDPRKHGLPKDGIRLSKMEMGQEGMPQGSFFYMGSLSRSSGLNSLSGPSGVVLLGSYAGLEAGALFAAFSPGAAAIYAPLAAAAVTAGTLRFGRRYS